MTVQDPLHTTVRGHVTNLNVIIETITNKVSDELAVS